MRDLNVSYVDLSLSRAGTPPFWHHRQLNMIRLIMRGHYNMDGPAWTNVTTETKDLIRRLLVVDPKQRLSIKGALEHEVFHAQRYTRVGGEVLCIVHEDVESDSNEEEPISMPAIVIEPEEAEQPLEERKKSSVKTFLAPILSAKKLLSRRKTSILTDVKFNPRRTFRTAIICVRFLVRFRNIKTTPVLLSLEMTRINPYMIRSYRKSIDMFAFGLYHHWIKKGQGQDRAAVFQHQPKRDLKKKKKASTVQLQVPKPTSPSKN